MAGKRLLDVASLFNASRGVAQKHVALRARQLDVYNRTSTFARAVQNQTSRVTETVKAASFLASRMNDPAPAWTSEAAEASEATTSHVAESIPRKESTEGPSASRPRAGIEQDHFYERSKDNSAIDPAPEGNLEIQQQKADQYPLADGTISPTESPSDPPSLDHEILLTRPQDEPPKDNNGIEPTSSSEPSIPAPARRPPSAQAPGALQRQAESQIPSKTADAHDESVLDPLEHDRGEDSVYRKSTHTSHVFSSLPRVTLPKHSSSIQNTDAKISNGEINSDSFYTAGTSEAITRPPPTQAEAPEGINTALCHSSSAAKILGGKTQQFGQSIPKTRTVSDATVNHSDLGVNKSQFTLNFGQSAYDLRNSTVHIRASKEYSGAIPETERVTSLARDISKGVDHPEAQVRLHESSRAATDS